MKKFSQEAINNSEIVKEEFDFLADVGLPMTMEEIFTMFYESNEIDENGNLTTTGKKELKDTEKEA